MATIFGWKKKISHDLSRKRAAAFDDNEQNDEETSEETINERLYPNVKRLHKEKDDKMASVRLRKEGAELAEQERLETYSLINIRLVYFSIVNRLIDYLNSY